MYKQNIRTFKEKFCAYLKYKNRKFNRQYKEHKCSPAFEIREFVAWHSWLAVRGIYSLLSYHCFQIPALDPQLPRASLLVLCLNLYFPGFDLVSYQAFRVTIHLLNFCYLHSQNQDSKISSFWVTFRRFDFRVESLKTK